MDSTPVLESTVTANCIALIVCSFLGLAFNIVPLLTLVRVRNLAAVTIIIANMITLVWVFVNGIIWHNDNQAAWWSGRGLCDVQVAIKTPFYTLMAASTCRLGMDLARAVDVDNPRLFESESMRRRRVLMGCFFMFTVPVVQLVTHYLVQTQRYAILAVYGCTDFLDLSWPRIVLLSIWPLLFGLLNCWYAILTIHRLRKHRGRLSKTLSRSGSGLDARKFLKLFLMAVVVLLLYMPLLCYFFYIDWPAPFYPYSFSRVHGPLWNVPLFLHVSDYPEFQYLNWSPVALGFLIFFFYGVTAEAINRYRVGLVKIGLDKVWPFLKVPYVPSRSTRGSSFSRTSWLQKFDVMGKAVSYMDSKKDKATQTESSVRKGSHAPSTTVSDPDTISALLPTHSRTTNNHSHIQEFEHQPRRDTQAYHSPPRNILSSFRTHLNFPFPLFSGNFTTPKTVPTSTQTASELFMEKPSTNPDSRFTADPTVSTAIWSSPPDEEKIDPLSPKLGTRAYRERERRERDALTGAQPASYAAGVEVKSETIRKEEAASSSSSGL